MLLMKLTSLKNWIKQLIEQIILQANLKYPKTQRPLKQVPFHPKQLKDGQV
jgi:hypothetical protein